MVINFEFDLNPTSVIITTIVTFHLGKCLFHISLAQVERTILRSSQYFQIKYILNYYTEEEFKMFGKLCEKMVVCNIYEIFYDVILLVAILILEGFELIWRWCDMYKFKFRLTNESRVSILYLMALRTLFLIAYFPIHLLKLRITKQEFGEFLLWHLLYFARDIVLLLIFTIPAFHLIKYFKHNIIYLLWAIIAVTTSANFLTSFNIFTSLQPLENGSLRNRLEQILPQINVSIDDIYHSEEETNEKVYFNDKWFRKAIVITGSLPVDRNVSLMDDSNAAVQFTTSEIIALIVFKIGEASKGYSYSTFVSIQVHLFSLMLICWPLYEKEYLLVMAGFREVKPVVANLLVLLYFIMQPYWTFMYHSWKNIYQFTQLTEAQFLVSHFGLQTELVNALVKIYKLNEEFPVHSSWYAIFNGYRRPLNSLVLTLLPPNLSYHL